MIHIEREAYGNGYRLTSSPSVHRVGVKAKDLNAVKKADRERIATIQARQRRTNLAEALGILIEGEEWVRVTFAEKPSLEILDALRTAGFQWGGGSWVGRRNALPESVMAQTSTT